MPPDGGNIDHDDSVLGNSAGRATGGGDGGVADRFAGIPRDGVVKTQGLADDGAKIAVEKLGNVLVDVPRRCGSGAKDTIKFLLQLGLSGGVEGHKKEYKGKSGRGSVEASHNVEEHVAKHLCFSQGADTIAAGCSVA
jgi:hypothetical protein